MRFLPTLFLISASGVATGLLLPGSVAAGWVLLAGAVSAAALFLLLQRWLAARRPPWIVVDDSNVMHGSGGQPSLGAVAAVMSDLSSRGYRRVAWFDANVGHELANRYMAPHHLAAQLDVPARQIFVAPKAMQADRLLLSGAAVLQARVVSNDRFRDWTDSHPQVAAPGFLMRGSLADGRVALELFEA